MLSTIPLPLAVLIPRYRRISSTVSESDFFHRLKVTVFLGFLLFLFGNLTSSASPVGPIDNSLRPISPAKLKSYARAATAAVPTPAYAGALILKRSVAELATNADRIVVADVLRVQSEFNVDKSNIFTFVTLAVDKILKGHSNAQATLALPGGEVEGTTLLVGGVPNFIAGERVLLFLDDESEIGIAGMWQGKYSLSGDEAFQPETGQTVSVSSLEDAINNALNSPVEIGTSPQIVHAEFTISCDAWDTTNNTFPINYYVNPNNPGTDAPTGFSFVSAMYDALYAWQELSDSWITLHVAGTTTRDATLHFDGNNDIAWTDLSGATLGVNYCATQSGERIDSDTQFDNSSRAWTMTAESGKFDLRATAEHEFGHGIGIGHSNQTCNGLATTPLMCGTVSAGVRKTILTDDSDAAESLYPLSGSKPNAPSSLSVDSSGTFNNLSWTDNSNNEHAFEIQRADSCSNTFKGVATVSANSTSFSDNDYGVGLSGVYCYRVKALNRGGDSGYSNAILNIPVDVEKAMISTEVITASSQVTYTVTIANNDSSSLANVTVSENLPANAGYVSGSATVNPVISLGNFPTDSIPLFAIGANSAVVITYVLQVTDTAQKGDTLINSVTVSAPTMLESLQSGTTNYIDPYTLHIPIIFRP